MSAPIQSQGPTVGLTPDDLQRHVQIIYQKLGNIAQAFAIQRQQIAKLSPGSGGTSTVNEGGSSSSSIAAAVSQVLPSLLPTVISSLGAVNNQTSQTSYATQLGDNQSVVLLNDSSSIAISLVTQDTPYSVLVVNQGAGTATLTPATGTINGGASFAVSGGNTLALAWFDGTNWWAVAAGASSGGTITGVTAGTGLSGGGSSGNVTLSLITPVSVADGGTGTASPGLVAGSNITITGSWPNQTIAASGGGGGYLKGNITVTPSGPGTYQGSGTITGATVGSAVLVGVTNSTEASEVSNLLGWVTSTNNVTIQATFSSGVLGLNLPVVVFV